MAIDRTTSIKSSASHPHYFCDNCTYVRKRLDVSNLELHAKLNFDRDDEVDVIEGIPAGHVFTSSFHRQYDRVVQQQITKDSSECGQDFFSGHPATPARAIWVLCMT